MLTVKYFGVLTQYAKVNEEQISFVDSTLAQLLEIINHKYQINQLTFRVAINEKMVDDIEQYELKTNDVVALLPAFSGG